MLTIMKSSKINDNDHALHNYWSQKYIKYLNLSVLSCCRCNFTHKFKKNKLTCDLRRDRNVVPGSLLFTSLANCLRKKSLGGSTLFLMLTPKVISRRNQQVAIICRVGSQNS